MIRKTLLKYDTLWFVGDSLMRQQFYTFLCMIDMDFSVKDLDHYLPGDSGDREAFTTAEYIYNNSTKFLFSRFGYVWGVEEKNLYQNAFPKAVSSLTNKDVIIMDAAAHYTSTRIPLMERALTFIGNSSRIAKATIYYMEPVPEEWPTSNGIYAHGLNRKGKCQKLTTEQLSGHYNTSHVKDIMRKVEYQESPPEYFYSRYPQTRARFQENIVTTNECYPDCVPAAWRTDVARSILLSDDKDYESSNQTSKVKMVPVFWQFLDKDTASYTAIGDCTHKSLEGITMMNQQLIRAMIEEEAS